jgi:hypothetical protein
MFLVISRQQAWYGFRHSIIVSLQSTLAVVFALRKSWPFPLTPVLTNLSKLHNLSTTSWGQTWGENGHIRLSLGHNLCKISSDPTATSTKVLSTPPVPHQTCTDKAWHSSEGDPCSTYELNSYCTADGQEGEGWNSCEWGRLVNYADSHGVSAFDACCGCGGGSTGESAESSVRAPALTNVTSASSCTDVPHWRSSEGDSCCKYPWESYCTADGKEGPGWKSSWGRISDYSDSNGFSATDACCGCGGGSRSVVV